MLTILAMRLLLPVAQVQPTRENSNRTSFHDYNIMHFLLQSLYIMIMIKLKKQSEREIGDCDFSSTQQQMQQRDLPTPKAFRDHAHPATTDDAITRLRDAQLRCCDCVGNSHAVRAYTTDHHPACRPLLTNGTMAANIKTYKTIKN